MVKYFKFNKENENMSIIKNNNEIKQIKQFKIENNQKIKAGKILKSKTDKNILHSNNNNITSKKLALEKNPKDFKNEKPILKSISNKIKSTVKNFLSFAGYILYVYSETHLNCKLIPLTTLGSTIRINKDESIYLGKPAMFIEGKPLWIVVRGYPYTMELDMIGLKERLIELGFNSKEIDVRVKKDDTLLIRKGYSSSDIDAKTYSLIAKRVFRIPKMSMSNVILVLLLMLSSCLITYLITSMYFQSILK